MRSVYLLGSLGEQFGGNHKFDIKSAPEALRALQANNPSFQKTLMESAEKGVGYKVLVGSDWVTEDQELLEPLGAKNSIMIVPVIQGSGGVAKIFTGAALIGLSFLGGPAAPYLLSIGIGLSLSGVTQLLTPLPTFGANEAADNKPSYIFSGPVNTNSQGQCIPLGYGIAIVGSAVVSAGISVEAVPT